MAIITVIYDEHGIVRVEREETTRARDLFHVGRKLLSLGGAAKGNPLPSLDPNRQADLELNLFSDLENSDRLTADEKATYRALAEHGPFETVVIKVVYLPGEFVRTHGLSDEPGPPTYAPITRVVDP